MSKYIDNFYICFSEQTINSIAVYKLSNYSLSSILVSSESKNRCSLSDISNWRAIQNRCQNSENSFEMIIPVRIIQPKAYKRFHHLYSGCFTANIS